MDKGTLALPVRLHTKGVEALQHGECEANTVESCRLLGTKTITLYDEDLRVEDQLGEEEHINKRWKGNCSTNQDQDRVHKERETNGHKL